MPLIPHWRRRAGAGWALVLISVPALAHNPLASQGPEQWAALITVAWLLSFWGLYLWGSTRVSPGWLSAMVFHLTAILCAVTLLGPLDDWAKTSTAAHMVQHMLLMVVIAPLWVLCRPLPQLNAGGGPPAARIWRPGLQLARYPMYAAFLHGAIVWFWHMPYFYMLAVENVWWAILRAGQARTLWALVALLFTLMHTGFLGALLTFARDPLYAETRDLQDQQLAGLIMWVAGAVPYLIASAWMGHRWFQRICPA
jgi:putative membrane protein